MPGRINRVDVAGGTLSGWSAMLATAAGHRLAAGGEVTVLDLTEGSVALDLIALARAAGIGPLVWVLPEDLPRLTSAPDWTRAAWLTSWLYGQVRQPGWLGRGTGLGA